MADVRVPYRGDVAARVIEGTYEVLHGFDRAQENLTKSGLAGRSANGRRQHTHPVQGIDSDVHLNHALWLLADGLRQLKA